MALRVYLLVLVLCAAATTKTQGYDLMDSLTLRALMKGHNGQEAVASQDGKRLF